MATESTAMGIWSDLPRGPLYTILTCLSSFVDFISFSSVCRSWRAVASSLSPSQITSLFPPLRLLVRSSPWRHDLLPDLRLLDPASPSFSSSLNVDYVGFDFLSSHGRLLGWSGENQIVILNAFTGEVLYSPIIPNSLYSFGTSRTKQLSFVDSAVLLFISNRLYHWHIGSPAWSCQSLRIKLDFPITFAIVKGKVYAMDCEEKLFVLDLSPRLHLRQLKVDGIDKDNSSKQRFLVDCGGELLLIRRVGSEKTNCSLFEAFRLDLSKNRAEWVKKETLGNWAIFVGNDLQVACIAVENPERWEGPSNCVYFATGDGGDAWPWAMIELGEEFNIRDPESPLFQGNYRDRLVTLWVHPGF